MSASVGMRFTNPCLAARCTSRSPMLLGALLHTVMETLFWRCSVASARTGWKLCTLRHWTLDPSNHNELAPINGGGHMPTTPSSVNKRQPGVHRVQLPNVNVELHRHLHCCTASTVRLVLHFLVWKSTSWGGWIRCAGTARHCFGQRSWLWISAAVPPPLGIYAVNVARCRCQTFNPSPSRLLALWMAATSLRHTSSAASVGTTVLSRLLHLQQMCRTYLLVCSSSEFAVLSTTGWAHSFPNNLRLSLGLHSSMC